jgi:Na+/H+ antiporter NhaD/arsenite permease-like protein
LGAGVLSALLMNDTLAIIGTPIMLHLAARHNINPKALIITLAFAVTLGSVISPIGNPQNLLIALGSGLTNPFATFFLYLIIPTIINIFIAWYLIRIYFHTDSIRLSKIAESEPLNDPKLARLSRHSLILLLVMIAAKVILAFSGIQIDFKLTYIAIISALPIVLLSPKRFNIVRNIDWSTLLFFAAMFILMDSVWRAGFFQGLIAGQSFDLNSNIGILIFSTVVSQFISNVPLVALYLPVIVHNHGSVIQYMALAAGSTIAGNLLILGAASNIIIIQNAEIRSTHTITFFDFAKIGIPLTIANIIIYWLFFELIKLF